MHIANLSLWYSMALVLTALGLAIWLEKKRPKWRFVLRKCLHILVIFIAALSAMYISSPRLPMVGWVASVLLVFTINKGWFEDADIDGTRRKPWGMLYFSLSFSVLTSLPYCIPGFSKEYVSLLRWMNGWSLLVLAFADGLAGLLGRDFTLRRLSNRGMSFWIFPLEKERKTWFGFLIFTVVTFFVSAIVISNADTFLLGLPRGFGWKWLWPQIMAMSVFVAMVELVSDKGTDNLFVVVAVWLFAGALGMGLLGEPHMIFLVGGGFTLLYLLISFVAAYVLFSQGLLSHTGAVMAWIMAFVVILMANWSLMPLVVFLFLSTMFGRFRKQSEKDSAGDIKEGKPRDRWQVLANGGVYLAFAITVYGINHGIHKIFGSVISSEFVLKLYFLALISVSVSCADTLSSEVGQWLGGIPRSLITGKRLPRGLSGGVTGFGFLGAMVGSAAIGVVWCFTHAEQNFNVLSLSEELGFSYLMIFGMLGTIVDSALGDLFQAKYLLPDGQLSDKPMNDESLRPVRGLKAINNDVVNILTNFIVVGLAWFVIF